MTTTLKSANAILADAGTQLVMSDIDGSWATKRALPIDTCNDLERRLTAAGYEATTACDDLDRSVGWIYVEVVS